MSIHQRIPIPITVVGLDKQEYEECSNKVLVT